MTKSKEQYEAEIALELRCLEAERDAMIARMEDERMLREWAKAAEAEKPKSGYLDMHMFPTIRGKHLDEDMLAGMFWIMVAALGFCAFAIVAICVKAALGIYPL